MKQIQAKVSDALLAKASRMFTGTVQGRIIEILQNSRRAGADLIVIDTNEDGWVSIRDNGHGILDWDKILDMGDSGWDEKTAQSEDPAGVGLFSLAPRRLEIHSNGVCVEIDEDDWAGKRKIDLVSAARLPEIKTPTYGIPENVGTRMVLYDKELWSGPGIGTLAKYTGMRVVVDGDVYQPSPFITKEMEPSVLECPELGCRIAVSRSPLTRYACGEESKINFFGQLINFRVDFSVYEIAHFSVDMTGEPSPLRMMLPARTQLVENDAANQLRHYCRKAAYAALMRAGEHKLEFSVWKAAKGMGFELPEASPRCTVGMVQAEYGVLPVIKPKNFPLSRCYSGLLDDHTDCDLENIDILASLGRTEERFVPVEIQEAYAGYSWAKIPAVTAVNLILGKKINVPGIKKYLGSYSIELYDKIVIEVLCSDGKEFCASVPLAVQVGDKFEQTLCVTAEAENLNIDPDLLNSDQIVDVPDIDSVMWRLSGGYSEDGDTYDTQRIEFEDELDDFWNSTHGAKESLRRNITQALSLLTLSAWKHVTIESNGIVTIKYKDDRIEVLKPPTK